ncbi:helix-turn-helix domain-containing protein [Pedobacter montanisoli]|uniref:Helix-turn-helix domain-containing protein n=1 Tax=Pedobacter montanisoli TaxID=2923277 RepID=A0ABS9ZXV9_9SPHI|nr:helix-turn-helix transcriptional regulator [Pedobacter montanisoli]MCJ0743146.1 helix-turn-helix domain-containing protein [Pedobacter montanisoli]
MPQTPLVKEIGKNIRQLRLDADKGQTEVAKALDISVAALSKIESGLTDLNISRLAQIAKYFKVSVISIISKDIVSGASQDLVEKLSQLKNKLADKDREVMKLQQKVISLYEKLGI